MHKLSSLLFHSARRAARIIARRIIIEIIILL